MDSRTHLRMSLTGSKYQKEYLIVNHMTAIRSQHDEYSMRFAASMNQLQLIKLAKNVDTTESTHVKENMYLVIVEGFQLLSEWTGRIWEQSAWKFSRPAKDATPFDSVRSNEVSDYEKVVRCNYTPQERKATVELISYIKGLGTMMERVDTLVADSIWEVLHAQVQEFVQNKLAIMLRTTFKKKKDLSRILNDMRIIAADWMGNASQIPGQATRPKEEGGGVPVRFRTRATAPTTAQLHCLQYLIHELVSGGSLRKAGGFFSGNDVDIPPGDMRQLENFFSRLAFFPHILDYRATLTNLTDLGFLWFREFYLETSRVIQFPIECSLPWMLVEHVIESKEAGLLESILMPFDIYNDAADYALRSLKQRFLYDEIEAEVDLCFDQLVFRLSEYIFGYYKSRAARKLLDLSFLAVIDDREIYEVFPKRYDPLFRMRRVKLLGRTIDLAFLIGQRMNKIFRENLDFLFERFEAHDLCSIVELQRLVEILKLTHELLSEHVKIDAFPLIMGEMTETISLVSFSGRVATQVFTELQNDFFPNFILCTATQRFVRSNKNYQRPLRRPQCPQADPSFLCGTQELNMAHGVVGELHSMFFGLPHMLAVVKLLGSRSLPWLVRALLDFLSQKTSLIEPGIEELRRSIPKAIAIPSHDWGVEGCLRNFSEQLQWAAAYDGFTELLQAFKEMGSLIFWMGLLDTAMRQNETVHFMQVVPWLGVVPNKEGQLQQLLANDNLSPLVSLFKLAADEIKSNTKCANSTAFISMAKQAQVADILYMNNLQTGSILDYTLAYLGAELGRVRDKWDLPSKAGLIEITTSREFYRIFSSMQFHYLQGLPPSLLALLSNHIPAEAESFQEQFGDGVAWGACTIIYMLGQELRFELLDFTYHVLSMAETDTLPSSLSYIESRAKGLTSYSIGIAAFLENARRARRLNSHVFSVLRARMPHEVKLASLIKQNGSVVNRVKYPVTPSTYTVLPHQ